MEFMKGGDYIIQFIYPFHKIALNLIQIHKENRHVKNASFSQTHFFYIQENRFIL